MLDQKPEQAAPQRPRTAEAQARFPPVPSPSPSVLLRRRTAAGAGAGAAFRPRFPSCPTAKNDPNEVLAAEVTVMEYRGESKFDACQTLLRAGFFFYS